MAQMKEQSNSRKRTKWHGEIQLIDAEFKTLVIWMHTEIIEYSHKIKEEVKAIQNEIKKNIQGTNSEGNEARNQINDLDKRKK